MKRKTLLIGASLLLILPIIASAAGLVPCGGTGEPACQFCHVVKLVELVSDWLVTILTIIFAIIIVVAGLRMVVSSGDVNAKVSAKKMIINAAVGFMIVLAAWILIDLGMKALVESDSDLGPWNSIQCIIQPILE